MSNCRQIGIMGEGCHGAHIGGSVQQGRMLTKDYPVQEMFSLHTWLSTQWAHGVGTKSEPQVEMMRNNFCYGRYMRTPWSSHLTQICWEWGIRQQTDSRRRGWNSIREGEGAFLQGYIYIYALELGPKWSWRRGQRDRDTIALKSFCRTLCTPGCKFFTSATSKMAICFGDGVRCRCGGDFCKNVQRLKELGL